jgi:hypothetical protein
MNHYETSELPAKSDFSNNDSSHALFADTMGSNPFKMASKQETVILASNDGNYTEPHGPGIPDVPPVEPHNNRQDQQQNQQQMQDQTQQQQLNNRSDLSNNSATNVRTGDTIYRNNSYANARGEALPGNDCQLFAVRGDGYFLGTGGGAGLSVSSEECIKARAEKVTCDASVSLGVANQYNSAAEQSWLQHVSPAQQQQIIEHGMRNTQRISDNAVAKSGECTTVNQPEEAKEQPREVIVQSVDTSNLATKEELQQAEERSTHRVNQAFKHALQK